MDFKIKVTRTKKIYNILKDNNISETIINRLRKNLSLVLLNNKPSRVVDIAPKNSELIIKIVDKETNKIEPTFNAIEVLFEDDYMLAINKPPFVSSIPNAYKKSIASDILGHTHLHTYMPINRLDVETSGILLIAKNPLVQHKFTKLKKTYVAILSNTLKKRVIKVNAKIGEHKEFKSMRQVNGVNSKNAITIIKRTKKLKNNCSLCKINLVTGRTHQIRVHTSYINAPILGDSLYGKQSQLINRQALHAYKNEFIHPITRKKIKITAPIPEDIKSTINILKK